MIFILSSENSSILERIIESSIRERISNSMTSVVSPVIKKNLTLKLNTLYIKQAACITFYALTKAMFSLNLYIVHVSRCYLEQTD